MHTFYPFCLARVISVSETHHWPIECVFNVQGGLQQSPWRQVAHPRIEALFGKHTRQTGKIVQQKIFSKNYPPPRKIKFSALKHASCQFEMSARSTSPFGLRVFWSILAFYLLAAFGF